MLSQTNRVKAIKSRFESLNDENSQRKGTTLPDLPKRSLKWPQHLSTGTDNLSSRGDNRAPQLIDAAGSETERLNRKTENILLVVPSQLYKHVSFDKGSYMQQSQSGVSAVDDNLIVLGNKEKTFNIPFSSSDSEVDERHSGPTANTSYLYSKVDSSYASRTLSRQSSDPGKKLHRSHAFRCDRSQKLTSPKRHSSCSGRPDMSEAPTLRIGDKSRLSRDRLKKLGNVLEDRMRKENFIPVNATGERPVLIDDAFRIVPKTDEVVPKFEELGSIPDERVPKQILDQYAKVFKPKRKKPETPTEVAKQDLMTDSGVSSETEVPDSEIEKSGRLSKLRAHFEGNVTKTDVSNKENLLEEYANLVETTNLGKSEINASTETIRRIEKKNPNIILTDTLKKALKQPLPAGPPPKKPPRIFANTTGDDLSSSDFSPHAERKFSQSGDKTLDSGSKKPRKDPKHMLEKLEKALQHKDAKIIIPRSGNIYDIAEDNHSTAVEVPKKEMHYLCTEILDIAQRPALSNASGENNIASSLSNCFNSLNCSIPNGSSSSIAYAKLNSGPNSSRSSLTNVCCTCSTDITDTDIPDSRSKFSTFFSPKSLPPQEICKKCGINLQKDVAFQCHLSCKCENKLDKNCKFFVDNEHIYAEPYHSRGDIGGDCPYRAEGRGGSAKKSITNERCDVTAVDSVGSVNNIRRRWESADKCPSECDVHYGALNLGVRDQHIFEDQKIYDVPCDPSRSPSPEIVTSSPIEKHSFESLRRGFENIATEKAKPPPIKSKSLDTPEQNSAEAQTLTRKAERARSSHEIDQNFVRKFTETGELLKLPPEISSKPLNLPPGKGRSPLKPSKSSENLAKDFKFARNSLEKKFSTEGARRRRFERSAAVQGGSPSHATLGVQRKSCNRTRDQLDVDRANLNKLMNEIYETVSAACKMDTSAGDADTSRERGKPSKFPIDNESTGSEDSMKLSRSLTDKRKNYVRRVSSRVAYLEPQSRQNVRFRHQTSICSYKSENLQDQNAYATFRSWKSFKHSQILSKSNASVRKDSTTNLTDSKLDLTDSNPDLNDSGTRLTDSKRDSNDSKANLTDSRFNLLSMKDEMCSDEIDTCLYGDTGVDGTAGCLDIDLPKEAREKGLFDVCLLVGLNHMLGQAYVKSVFPKDVTVPSHIENLVFPETMSAEEYETEKSGAESRPRYDLDSGTTQCYSLVLTNEKGERSFGYCRRVLPEGASFCLPLAYCMIARFRAPGFYYKVLQELESHHGQSDQVLDCILQQLFDKDFPNPGETITITQPRSPKKCNDDLRKHSLYRNSVNLGDILKCKTLPDLKRSPIEIDFSSKNEPSDSELSAQSPSKSASITSAEKTDISPQNASTEFLLAERRKSSEIPDYYDIENNNRPRLRCLEERSPEVKVIKRPIEPRMDEDNLAVLFDSMNVNVLIKIFGTLLLERKVVLISDKLSQLSACMEALQAILYPLVWQQPLVATVPAELRHDMLAAPLPMLAGLLSGADAQAQQWLADVQFEEGMLVDLSPNSGAKVIFQQGDEATIVPNSCYKTLKTSLQMESNKSLIRSEHPLEKARNVLISEAFLRFFVEILADFWSHFKYGKRRREPWEDPSTPESDEPVVIFDKEQFIKSSPSKHIQYFLEWFTETAMFNHFVQNMSACYPARTEMAPLDFARISLVDTPLPCYYEVFEERITRRHLAAGGGKRTPRETKGADSGKGNYKNAVNKRVKLLKNKLRELVN